METKMHSLQFLRKRKFFLLLPLLVLPFSTLLFWALGGGRGGDVQSGQSTPKGSLNMQLPEAYLKDDKSLNKLSYYEKAASDSQKLEEQLKNDPYYVQRGAIAEGLHEKNDTGILSMKYRQNVLNTNTGLNTSPYNNSSYSDPNEAKVYEKLNELNSAMNTNSVQSGRIKDYSFTGHGNQTFVNSDDIDRLQQMMNLTRNGDSDEDPEIKQLNGMMDKILAIQHPERVKENGKKTPDPSRGQVFAVTADSNNDYTSLLQTSKGTSLRDTSRNNDFPANGFFSLQDDVDNSKIQANVIQAVIHEAQTVVDGAIVKLRLQTDVSVNGTLVPKGKIVFGTASLNGERLNININSLRYNNSLFPVRLSVFDLDGMEGVYVPGVVARDVAKNSADRAVQSIGMPTLETSLGAQATSAGIEAAKTLLSRKAKLVKVTLKGGYRVLLRDTKQTTSF